MDGSVQDEQTVTPMMDFSGAVEDVSGELQWLGTDELGHQSLNPGFQDPQSQIWQHWQQERQQLEHELAQTHAIAHQQNKRISHLEQALDQAMVCLEDLRHQLQDQEMLEAQLAMTEEFANVQQQAIVRLKRQLAGQESVHREAGDRSDEGAPSVVARLTRFGSTGSAATEGEADLAAAHAEIEALTGELEERATLQARLQHSCQELTTDRDRLQTRVTTLEQQNAELQEQILKQMKQISDYETGVQHWKDRYSATHQQATQLKNLLERVLTSHESGSSLTPELESVLAELRRFTQMNNRNTPPANNSEAVGTVPPAMRISPDVNIPEFLLRRRRSKTR